MRVSPVCVNVCLSVSVCVLFVCKVLTSPGNRSIINGHSPSNNVTVADRYYPTTV